MIGIDINVLIRYIVQDDPEQSALATHFLEKSINAVSPGYISQIVICEIVWVLKRAYRYEKSVIIQVIRQILNASELIVENSESVWQALKDFELGDADFSDYLIAQCNRYHGCDYTITFDKQAVQHPLVKLCQ